MLCILLLSEGDGDSCIGVLIDGEANDEGGDGPLSLLMRLQVKCGGGRINDVGMHCHDDCSVVLYLYSNALFVLTLCPCFTH